MLPQIASSLASDSSTNNQTVHTVNLPATIYTNDLILCIIAANNGTPSVTELSGFTVVNTASEAFVFAKISDYTKGVNSALASCRKYLITK